jgi:hypothetical protein
MEQCILEDAMVQMKRSELTPEEWDRLKNAAAGKPEERSGDTEKDERLAAQKISVEEHLAGLWNVLGLGD